MEALLILLGKQLKKLDFDGVDFHLSNSILFLPLMLIFLPNILGQLSKPDVGKVPVVLFAVISSKEGSNGLLLLLSSDESELKLTKLSHLK
jgi:hypothetical protein